jgi:predicted GNAT family N-acyltransferase
VNKIEKLHLKTCLFMEEDKAIRSIRTQVFQQEQGIAADLDFDGLDDQSVHLLAQVGEIPVGVARLRELEDKSTIKLERLAILSPYRNQGLGGEMVSTAITYTTAQGYRHLKLHAQISSLEFYRRLGFLAVGEPFLEAGIEHVKMEQPLLSDRENAVL